MKQRKSTIQILFYCLLLILMPASAYALNLGEINLKSAPDEPLEAEIQLLGVAPEEQDSLSVGLADVAGFRWAGIEWSPVLNQLQFELARGADGSDYIRIHSREVIRTSLLHFLLKVAWSKGRLFREYTVELDTPLHLLPDEQPAEAAPQSSPAPAVERDWNAVRSNVRAARNYGPVIEHDTLWSLARELRPDTSVSIQQMMLALLRTNPDAFSYGNINWLRKDAVLWMPNDFELQALTRSEAFAEVLAQNNFWRAERGYATIDTGLQTAPGTVEVDGGLRLVAVAEEDLEGDGTSAIDPEGIGDAETLVLANEQVEELSLENIELEDKLTEAETIIEDLRRLVELKDDELAALQAQELSEQAEPGPDLVERLESFHDSTLEPVYNLARDNWQIVLACLAALLLLAGWWLLRRKSANAVGGLAVPAATIRQDFVKVTGAEKADSPEEIIEGEDDFADEIETEEEESHDETEAGLDDNQEDGEWELDEEEEVEDEEEIGDEEDEEDMVQNKLELARAYLELGDAENVRSILHEVLSEGNATQREEARLLLEQTASE